ncbi:hypothetical protein TIFTF001_036525 [Ficus carica]|uniref:Uncharacterized protein n=1 Tax=Ficus carica TaxID=3494 RepID=A0AA88E733_FICCA|nr:hypothetical protein TIFTF001_036525 [Ficus carica]
MDEDRVAAFDGTRRTVSLAGWLYDIETIIRICHIEARLQVLLACRRLVGDARLWWLTQGKPAIQGGSWADFRALIIARYGPLPDEEANMPYRDPNIYNNMYMRRYLNYVAEWYAYPNEFMGHYCQRDELPPEVKQFVPAPIMGISLEDMIDAIIETEIIAYMVQGGPILPEDSILAIPLQEIPPKEAGADAYRNEEDPADLLPASEYQPEDLPVTIIASDDDEDDEEEEIIDIEEPEDDPEEILFDDGDWDTGSNIFSDVMTRVDCLDLS